MNEILYETIKIWTTTLAKLRLLKGLIQKPMVEILDELVDKRLEEEKKKQGLV